MIHMTTPSAFARVSYVPCEVSLHAFIEDDQGHVAACDPTDPGVCGYSVWVRGVNPGNAADFDCIAVYERDFYARDCGGDIEASEQATAYAQQLVTLLGVPLEEY